MAILFKCPGCRKVLQVPDEQAGRRSKCPTCSTVATVPAKTSAAPARGPATPAPKTPSSKGPATPTPSAKGPATPPPGSEFAFDSAGPADSTMEFNFNPDPPPRRSASQTLSGEEVFDFDAAAASSKGGAAVAGRPAIPKSQVAGWRSTAKGLKAIWWGSALEVISVVGFS